MNDDEVYFFKGYNIPVPLLNKTGGGTDTFDIISHGHIEMLRRFCDLNTNSNIFELGCGIGRDAIPLSEMISPEATYVGVDIIPDSIKWCQNNISIKKPNFKFHYIDVEDHLHNPKGKVSNLSVKLPSEDNSRDIIFLQSVFTHMFMPEVEHYLSEFYRILKSSGTLLVTAFVYNDEIIKNARKNKLTMHALGFSEAYDSHTLINKAEHPRGALAFEKQEFDIKINKAGFDIVEMHHGTWSGTFPNSFTGQDLYILRRTL